MMQRLILIGACAGALSGLLGVGGGVIIVPLLALWLHFPQKEAQATSLIAIVFISVAGAVSYASAGNVLFLPALLIATAGIFGTFLGAFLLHRLAEKHVQSIFILILCGVAVRLALGTQHGGVEAADSFGIWQLIGFGLTGLTMGTLSSLVGIGGGIILVPLLIFGFGIGSHSAQGTSLVAMIPIALAGAISNSRHGYSNWRAGVWIGAIGAFGATVGALFALSVPEALLQRIFALLLLYSAYRLLKERRAHPRTDR